MPQRFNSYLDTVDIDFWRELCQSQGELRHYERDERFITAGTVARYLGYIESGALKYECYSEEGSPHVVGLEFAGNFVADFPFSLYGRKSRCSIIATTPCEILCVPVVRIAEQMKTDGRVREIVHLSTMELFGMVYDRQLDLYNKTPQERLQQLLSTDPKLFQLYSLQDIASLLNITPTHLSRLRKKLWR